MALPYVLDIGVGRSAAYLSGTITWVASGELVDLTGASASLAITYSGSPVLTLTTGNGDIALGGTAGTIQFSMTSGQTATLTYNTGYVYTLIVTISGVPTTIASGNVIVSDTRGQIPTASPVKILEKGAQGPPGLVGQLNATTFAGLTDITTATNGALAFVISRRAFFRFDSTSTASPDAVDVANGYGGSGRWIRLQFGDWHWGQQTAFYVNASTGSDDNAGTSSNAPIKTLAELHRRLQGQTIASSCTITLQTDFASSDPLNLICTLGSGASLSIVGTRATSRSGTLTGVTTEVQSTNTAWLVTDTGVSNWTSDVGYLVNDSTAGALFWVEKNAGSNAARINQPMQSLSASTATPATSDSYQVKTLSAVYLGRVSVDAIFASNTGTTQTVTFSGLTLANAGSNDVDVPQSSAHLAFYECRFNSVTAMRGTMATSAGTACTLSNCYFAGGYIATAQVGEHIIRSCVFKGSGLVVLSGARVTLSGAGSLVTAGGVTVGTGGSLVTTNFSIGVFDTSGDGVTIHPHGLLQSTGTGIPWGSSNSGYGLTVDGGGTFRFSTAPTVTGTSGDFRCGNTNLALTILDVSSSLPPQPRSINQTWANLVASLPSGFGSNCVNPANGARIIGATSGNLSNPSHTAGALVYDTGSVLGLLSPGTNGHLLQMVSGSPAWATYSGSATPSGAAGGDLGGTYPNPTVVAWSGTSGVIDNKAGTITNNASVSNLTWDWASTTTTNSVTLKSGTNTTGSGGAFTIQSGSGGLSGTGGTITLSAQNGTVAGGNIDLIVSQGENAGEIRMKHTGGTSTMLRAGSFADTAAASVRLRVPLLGDSDDSKTLRLGYKGVSCTAGGTITLLNTDYMHSTIKLIGSPGAGFTVVFPAQSGFHCLVINTTGQTATIQASGGSATVQIATGNSAWIGCDGTDVYGLTNVTSATPSGAAGGDLGGTYPSPTVVALTGTSNVLDNKAATFRHNSSVTAWAMDFSSATAGGTIAMTGGTKATSGAGGSISLTGGATGGTSVAGGPITLTGGSGGASASAGTVSLIGGAGGAVGGNVVLKPGSGDSSGEVQLKTSQNNVVARVGYFSNDTIADSMRMSYPLVGYSGDSKALRLGYGTFSCTSGGTLTLANTDYCNSTIKLTGSPGADFTVQFPAQSGYHCVVINTTSKTATLKASGGTATVSLATSSTAVVGCDGTDLYGIVPSAGGGGGGGSTATGTYASRAAASTAGNLYFPTDAWSISRDSGSAWAEWGPIYKLTPPPAVSTWTWVNQGSATATDSRAGLFLEQSTSEASYNIHALVRSLPSTPYTITVKLVGNLGSPTSTSSAFGAGWRQSSDGKLVLAQFVPYALYYQYYSSPTAYAGAYISGGTWYMHSGYWLRFSDDSTNRKLSVSVDGVNFMLVHSVSRTNYMTADQFCINVQTGATPSGLTLMSYVEA